MTVRAGQQSRYLTPPEVAARFRVKVTTIRSWIVAGRLKAINVSATVRPKYRIRPADLEAFERSIEVAGVTKVAAKTRKKRPPNYLSQDA